MSPEVALLVRAALLGLFILMLEHVGRRRQHNRAGARRMVKSTAGSTARSTVVRLPETLYPAATPVTGTVTGRPLVLEATRTAKPVQKADRPKFVLEPYPAVSTDGPFDGHVTEKRAA